MIKNRSRDTLIASNVEWALTPQQRMRGLLDRDHLETGRALIISPCNSIHMFFMKFAIDVLFVSEAGVVVRAIENLRPWRFTRIYLTAKHTIELPLGSISLSSTEKGDQLELPSPEQT